jgi:hypothetical protein
MRERPSKRIHSRGRNPQDAIGQQYGSTPPIPMNPQKPHRPSTSTVNPSTIRRLFDFQGTFGPAARLQGPAKQSVDELLSLTLEYGMSVFILGGNARAIEWWGSEVAPALRDAVARERRRRAPQLCPTSPIASPTRSETSTSRYEKAFMVGVRASDGGRRRPAPATPFVSTVPPALARRAGALGYHESPRDFG